MNDNIQIFAADHRQNVDWNLPYIRVGNFQSDALVKIQGIDPVDQLAMSEGAHALYVAKHMSEFGNPNYVGLCHYRRFFTKATTKTVLVDLQENEFNPAFCMTPIEQLIVLKEFKADFLVFARVQSYKVALKDQVQDIVDELYLHSKNIDLSMSKSDIADAFDTFIDCLPTALKDNAKAAMSKTSIHCCNLLTTTSALFVEWCETYEKAFSILKSQFRNNANKRWFGYLLERFTSLWIDANAACGKNKTFLPLCTINGNVHLNK